MVRVKGQRSRLALGLGLQKHTEGDRVAGVSYALYRVPSLWLKNRDDTESRCHWLVMPLTSK